MTRKNDADEGYLEVQMDGKQVVIVIAGVLLLCVISFYFGRRVGRAEAAGRTDPVLSVLGSSPEAIEEEDAGADLTFFDSVGDRPGADASPPMVSGGGSAPPGAKPGQPESTGAREPVGGSPGPAVSPGTTGERRQGSRPSTPAGSSSRSSGAGGAVEIQVGVYSTRAAAESLASRLRAKGYRPSITPTNRQGKTVYRVRVGGYATRAAAQTAAARLEREEKLATWIPPQGG